MKKIKVSGTERYPQIEVEQKQPNLISITQGDRQGGIDEITLDKATAYELMITLHDIVYGKHGFSY